MSAMNVVVFISPRRRGRQVHSREPFGSSGSFDFVGFILARPGGDRVYSGYLG